MNRKISDIKNISDIELEEQLEEVKVEQTVDDAIENEKMSTTSTSNADEYGNINQHKTNNYKKYIIIGSSVIIFRDYNRCWI